MSYRQKNSRTQEEADLDITPFMNLMIVLVPVLLLSMVFTRITIIDLQLPAAAAQTTEGLKQQQVELILRPQGLLVNFPEGVLLREIPNKRIESDDSQKNGAELMGAGSIEEPDYAVLSNVLQELKRHLRSKDADRKNINFLIQHDMPYQKIIAAMDSVRSYQAVVAASVVDAELFPDIAFADLPLKVK